MIIDTDSGRLTIGARVSPLSGAVTSHNTGVKAYEASGSSLTVSHPFGSHFLRHGWTSWSSTRWWDVQREPWRVWDKPQRTLTAEDAATDSETDHLSYMLTAVESDSGRVLLVGILEGNSPILRVASGSIEASSSSADARWFVAEGPEIETFEAYTTAIAETRKVRSPLRALEFLGPIWSSWYSWFEEITDSIITDETAEAERLGYGTIQIDDGWEKTIGDWRANEKFSRGIADLASRIHDHGMKAGLWISPFIAMPDAPVVQKYPELFLHDEDGNLALAGFNWGRNYYGLDLSLPMAHEWLAHTMSEIAGWGIDMFKLDFLYAGAIAAQRSSGMDREQAYRLGLETIRDAVGDEVYLLGSGAVMNASLGVLDGVRVGPDTAPYWDNTERIKDPTGPSVLNAIRNSLSRTWLYPLIDVDPDVAFFRTRGSLLSPEVNALTADVALVCRFVQCSDPVSWLDPAERERVQAWIRAAREHPVIERSARYIYRINGKSIDFAPYLNSTGRISDRLLVK